MIRKVILALVAFLLVGACAFGIGTLAEPETAVLPIKADSPCPVVGCTSGVCHGFDNVPEPDGIHELSCPEASCASTECHAWDSLMTRYHQASDASLNVWILTPVALVVGLVVLVRVLSKKDREGSSGSDEEPRRLSSLDSANGEEGEKHE